MPMGIRLHKKNGNLCLHGVYSWEGKSLVGRRYVQVVPKHGIVWILIKYMLIYTVRSSGLLLTKQISRWSPFLCGITPPILSGRLFDFTVGDPPCRYPYPRPPTSPACCSQGGPLANNGQTVNNACFVAHSNRSKQTSLHQEGEPNHPPKESSE